MVISRGSASLSTTNLTLSHPELKPSLHGEKPASSHLSYGPALSVGHDDKNNNK
jgi:hypothetical protein